MKKLLLILCALSLLGCGETTHPHGDVARSGNYAGVTGLKKLSKLAWKSSGFERDVAPVLRDGAPVVATTNGVLVTIDPETGKTTRKVDVKGGVESSVTFAGNLAVFASRNGVVRALDVDAEKPADVWTFDARGRVTGNPAVVDDLVVFGTTASRVYAVSLSSGEEVWSYETKGELVGEVAIASGYALVTSDDGVMQAIQLSTGQQIWAHVAADSYSTYPVVHADHAIAGTEGGDLYAVVLETGREKWRVKSGSSVVGIATFDGVAYFGNIAGNVVGVSIATAQEKWRTEFEAAASTPPSIAGSLLYIGLDNGQHVVLSTDDGKEQWRFKTDDAPASAPAPGNDEVYFLDRSGTLYRAS